MLTQIDKIEPCREWNSRQCQPGPCQQRNISDKQILLSRLFEVPLSHICATASAEGYGLGTLVEQIVRALPNEKKWGFTREARQNVVSSQARQASTQGLWETVKTAAAEILKESWERVSSAFSSLANTLFRSWW